MPEQDLIKQASTRLRRIEGQVRGIQGMLSRMQEDPASRNELRRRVDDLAASGKSAAEISRTLGISRQRISDIEGGCDDPVGEPCDGLLTQILAVRAAVEQVGLLILEVHLQRCVLEGVSVDDGKMSDLRETLKLWSRLTSPAR